MPNYRKTMLTLPLEVFEAFDSIEDNDIRDAYMVALRDAEWTLQSISEAANITRERVRQIVEKGSDADASAYPLPEPPVHEVKAPREYVEPDAEKLARLKVLKPFAERVRANSPEYREEAEEYSKLIADVHLNDGVSLYRLAKRLEVSHSALRFRLARYGYKQPKSGTSKVYAPIRDENRVPAAS
jgi:hypothetical protein